MKKLKTNIKIIVAVVLGMLISIISSYVLAGTLVNSKDVVYEDNSNLAADNVQDAIDGTCSKIDTRLSDIEDKLYIVKDMYMYKAFTSSTSLAYTGASIDFPANSMCSISVQAIWNHGAPKAIALSTSSTTLSASTTEAIGDADQYGFGNVRLTLNKRFTEANTYYVWAKYDGVGSNPIIVNGYCATKYK